MHSLSYILAGMLNLNFWRQKYLKQFIYISITIFSCLFTFNDTCQLSVDICKTLFSFYDFFRQIEVISNQIVLNRWISTNFYDFVQF